MKKTLMLIMLLLLPASSVLPAPSGSAVKQGLLFDKDDIPRLRQLFADDPMFASLRTELLAIDRAAERRFLKTEIRYNDHLYDIARVYKLAEKMAFLYLFTGDKDAGNLAAEAMEALQRFPIWDYFLDGETAVMGLQRAPGSTVASVICAEILGELVGEQTVKRWIRTMGERGCEPSFVGIHGMRHPETVKGWHFNEASTYLEHRPGDRGLDLSRWPYILNTINLKAVPAGALALGALAYEKFLGESADTRRWLEQAIYSVDTFKDIFKADGSYEEGVSYAHYTSLHLVHAIVAIQRRKGMDYSDIINWPGYITYLREMTMPTRQNPVEIVNFSDAGAGAKSSVAFWVADHARDGAAQWYAQELADSHDEWSLLWYNPDIAPEPPVADYGLWHSSLDWMVGRTGYGPDDLVLAMRSGPPANHEHGDRNSIILKCFGEQLVTDPHRPPYAFTDSSWVMRLTGGHSAVLIDGKGHQYVDGREGTNASKAAARIVRSGVRDGYIYWTSDATPAYALVLPDVSSVTRTVVMVPSVPAVLVFDKVLKSTTASVVQARFFAYNNDGEGTVEAAGSEFTTIRPYARLKGVTFSPQEVRTSAQTLPVPKETAVKYPFAQAATQSPANAVFLISVLLPERGAGGFASATISAADGAGGFRIEMQNGNGAATCEVFDTGRIPEFGITWP